MSFSFVQIHTMIVETPIAASSSIRVLQTLVKSKSDEFWSIRSCGGLGPFGPLPLRLVAPDHGDKLVQLGLALLVIAEVFLSSLRASSHDGPKLGLDNETLLLRPGNPGVRQRESQARQQQGGEQHGCSGSGRSTLLNTTIYPILLILLIVILVYGQV